MKSPLAHGSQDWQIAHEAIKADNRIWQALAFAYLQHSDRDGLLEYRHCPCCTSTIARSISATEAGELLSKHEQLLNWSRRELEAATPRRAA
jgi:hypothetical protein